MPLSAAFRLCITVIFHMWTENFSDAGCRGSKFAHYQRSMLRQTMWPDITHWLDMQLIGYWLVITIHNPQSLQPVISSSWVAYWQLGTCHLILLVWQFGPNDMPPSDCHRREGTYRLTAIGHFWHVVSLPWALEIVVEEAPTLNSNDSGTRSVNSSNFST